MDIKYKTICGDEGVAVIARWTDRRIRVARFNSDGSYRVSFWRTIDKGDNPDRIVSVSTDRRHHAANTELELSNEAMIALGTCIAMIGEMRQAGGCKP